MTTLEEGWACVEAEEYIRAEQLFKGLLDSVSDNEGRQARFGLGYALAFLDRFDEARTLYQSLREDARQRGAAEEEHRALHQVGMVERMAGDWEAACQVFSEEAQLIAALGDPALPVAVNRYEQGIVALHLGQREDARTHLETALRSALESGDQIAVGCAQRGLGDWAAASDKPAEARDWWAQARVRFSAAGSAAAVRDVDERLSEPGK